MNILILNGSPRKAGNVSAMLDIMRDEAERRGHAVTVLRAADLSVSPCRGCMMCRTSLRCSLPEDDAQRVLRLLREADALIIGSPCYWGNIPGQLKTLFDRMVYGMMGETKHGLPQPLHKGKRAVIVATSTTPFPFNVLFAQTRGVVRALREILGYSGFRVAGTLQKGGTGKHPALTEAEKRKCRKLINTL